MNRIVVFVLLCLGVSTINSLSVRPPPKLPIALNNRVISSKPLIKSAETRLYLSNAANAQADEKTNKFVKVVYQISALLGSILIFYPPRPYEDKVMYMVAAMNSFVLASAASRGRLSGTTFKLLNLSTITVALPYTIQALRKYRQVFQDKALTLMFFMYLFQTKGSFKSLRVHGLPSLKVEIPKSLLSAGYLVSCISSLYFGANQMHLNPSIDGVAAIIVMPTIHYILSLAANANRLNSATYRELNILVVLASTIKLINNGFQWTAPLVFSAFHGIIALRGLIQGFFVKT